MATWWERADWSWQRRPEFGGVDEVEGWPGELAIEMTLGPQAQADEIWRLWAMLEPSPFVHECAWRGVMLYSAIDWTARPVAIDAPGAVTQLAGWGVALTRAYDMIQRKVPASSLGRLATPLVTRTLRGTPQLAFVTPRDDGARIPPELVVGWPRCDARGLVHVVGQLLAALIVPDERAWDTALGQIIERCVAVDPARRFRTLADLRAALLAVSGTPAPPELDARAWPDLERGLGWLAAGRPHEAQIQLRSALNLAGGHPEVAACLARADELAARTPRPRSHAGPAGALPWRDALAAGAELEQRRSFGDALALYTHATVIDAERVARFVAMARCAAALGESGHAQAYATEALALAPEAPGALALRAEALLARREPAAALRDADAWIARAPTDGRAGYTRGKALLALGRLVEARDAFGHACTLAPELLEAMLLRREADRMLGRVRAATGTALPQALALPAHLDELREVLVAGRTDDAIVLLRAVGHARDPDAQRLLGELLTYEQRYEEALAVFVGFASLGSAHVPDALVGQGTALLGLGRAPEALARFDRALASRPDLPAAVDGRARALAHGTALRGA